MLSPTYVLIEASKLDVPFNLEVNSGLPSKVFKGCMVVIGLEKNGGGIKAFSNSLTLSLESHFHFLYLQLKTLKHLLWPHGIPCLWRVEPLENQIYKFHFS
jgi:hypothetical protein